jgi:hypothetical protein
MVKLEVLDPQATVVTLSFMDLGKLALVVGISVAADLAPERQLVVGLDM